MLPHHRSPDTCCLLLQRFIDDIRQRGVAVEDVDVEALVLQRAHCVKPLFFTRPTAAHPNLYTLRLAVTLCLAESIDDAAEGLLRVGKIGDCPADDNILYTGQRTD